MIEQHRDEICRRWDVLADEDHNFLLSEQEYFYYKNQWWLHSNKSGSNTLPLRNRSDFKQALSTLQRLQQEAGEEPYVPTYFYKHKQWNSAQSSWSTWWNWQGSWWSSCISERQRGGNKVLRMNGDLLLIVLWRKPPKMPFKNSIHFVTDGSFAADGGLL